MPEELFDLSDEYEAMLRMGVDLSGEDPAYFLRGRVADLARALPKDWAPKRILDFGCGTGESSAHLAERYPKAVIFGIDTSDNAIALARHRHGSERVLFGPIAALPNEAPFDLCYVNGVFHHIEPERRLEAVRAIHTALAPGGYFALFENNPWNPGTRMVMSRIPFDRDAKTLSFGESKKLVRAGGFRIAQPARFLFYFPRPLAFLRAMEPVFLRLPLGAQYCVLGSKP
ncbi:MAG TPA: class I SAM-dependent methyltransferase [Bryobacteraceae bacterium]